MFNIPEKHLPDFVKDNERLHVLFAPLRSRTANSVDWSSKITSWKTLIELYCIHNSKFSFTLPQLNSIFILNGRPPKCLEIVLQEMERTGEIQPYENYLKNISTTSWSAWLTNTLIKQPVTWSLTKLRNTLLNNNNQNEKCYVELNAIKIKSEELLSSLPDSFKNKVVNLKQLMEITNNYNSVENLKLLLPYLVLQNKISLQNFVTDTNENIENILIKIGDGTKIQPINDVDIAVYSLEKNEKFLLDNVEILEEQIQDCIKEAKAYLKKGHKQMAKNCLRKRNELDKRVVKKANALHNVQVLLERIRDSSTDETVFDTYKQALSAFDSTLNSTGLTQDNVEDTMIKLGEMLDLHEDIQTTLSKPPVVVTESDSDFEEELAELMKSSGGGNGDGGHNESVSEIGGLLKELDISNLPSPPKGSPNSSKAEEYSLH